MTAQRPLDDRGLPPGGSAAPGRRGSIDVISLGRAALELHAQQLGTRVEHATSFASYLGGVSAGIAFGCARLGLRTAMLSRVGDDPAGRFLIEALAAEGCDVSHVAIDRERPTSLALLASGEAVPQMQYRDNCADMAIDDSAVDEAFVAQAHALVITGTQFSTETTDRVSSLALERARRNAVRTVLDIDYAPDLWAVNRPGAGTLHHLASGRVTAHLQGLVGRFDVVVGTREEIRIAGGSEDLLQALRALRGFTQATLVVKLGAGGCAIIEGEVPARIADAVTVPGWPGDGVAEVGAGDAFLAGILKGWLGGLDWRATGRLANACVALVAARRAGSSGMPTMAELEYFLSTSSARPDRDPHLARLHRVTPRRTTWDDLGVLAIDDRVQDFELAREAGVPEARLAPLKQLLVRALAETEQAMALRGHVGALIDDTYGEPALLAAAGRGWWLARPVEVPGSSPVVFEGGRSIGSRLIAWPRAQIVKCLVQFHPDEPVETRLEQETQLAALHHAVLTSGHQLLLEVIPPSSLPSDGDTLVRAIKRLYNIGIHPDWWSVEPMPATTWRKVDDLIAERDPYCRGVLMVDRAGGDLAAAAASRSCRGVLVGRATLREPSAAWLTGAIDDATLVARVRAAFEARIEAWQRERAAKAAT